MTNQEIKTVGQTIAAETQIGGNTAERVGGVIEGIGEALDNKDAAVGYYLATMSGSTIYINASSYRLGTGGNLRAKMPAAATTACTLTVGNANAVPLWYNGAAVSSDNSWEAGEIVTIFYDGTRFMASNSQGGGGQFGSGEKIKDILLSQALGAGTDAITSQKGVSDAIFNEIDISSIDTLKTLNDALAPSSSLKPTYYTVTAMLSSVKLKVGSMAVISDNMRHVVTEIMATHYLLDDAGTLTNEHSDAEIFFIYRSVKLSGGTLPDPAGVWTKWRYVNSSVWSTVAEKIKYDNSQGALVSENVQDALEELGNAVFEISESRIPAGSSTQQYYTYNNGVIGKTNNSNYRCWPPVDITGYEALSLKFYLAEENAKTFFTDENNIMVGDFLTNTSGDSKKYIIPQGASKLYFSVNYNAQTDIAIYGLNREFGKFATGENVKDTGITATIEQDSTSLVTSGGVYNLVDSVVGIGADVDLSGLTQQKCALGTTTWYLQQTYKTQKHIALPVMSGQKYNIKATSESVKAAYALVTSLYSPPYDNGDMIPFVSGEEERYTCDVGVDVLVDIPSDGAFLILTTVDGSGGSGNTISWQVKLASNIREEINTIESTVHEHADILSNCYHQAQGGTEVKTITNSDLQNGTPGWFTSDTRVTIKKDSLIAIMDALSVTLAITNSSVSGAVDRATITFYDSTKTILSALDLGWKYFTGGSDVVFDIDLTLPLYDNVAYVGVYFGSNNTNISPSLINTSGITFTLAMPSVRITKAVDTEMLDNKLNERKATDLLSGDINVIAHLGGGTFGGAVAPYNSMWSAIIAGKTGMKVCEFDIVFTSDDVPICCHDLTLKGSNDEFVRKDGMTIPSATPIGNITYATMMSDYEYRHGYAPYKEISTLDDVLRVYRDYNITPVIEIKNPATEMNETRYNIILDAVKKYIGIRNCILAMFDVTNAITLRGMSSELLIAISGNNASAVPDLITNAKEYNFICGLISSAITQAIVQQFIENDIMLYAWTIQDDFNAMLTLGVRSFICNDTADVSFTGGVRNKYLSNALDFSNITNTGTVTDGHLVLASGQTATLTSEVTSWLNAIKLNVCIKGTCTINANGTTYNVANDGFNDYMILLRQHDKSSVTVTINGVCEIASLAFETKSY